MTLTNVFRHANAASAQVRVEFGSVPSPASGDQHAEGAPAVLIEIEDNGVGISEQPSPGLGLLGMKERVQALGGTISIARRPGGGTRVAASLPLPKDEEDDE